MALPADLGLFQVYRGDAWSLPITDDDGGSPPTATDLTAYGDTWTCEARTAEDAESPIDVTIDDSDAATGQLTLSLDGATTTALTSDNYVFDVQVTGGPVDPLTLYRGRLKVTKDVTR